MIKAVTIFENKTKHTTDFKITFEINGVEHTAQESISQEVLHDVKLNMIVEALTAKVLSKFHDKIQEEIYDFINPPKIEKIQKPILKKPLALDFKYIEDAPMEFFDFKYEIIENKKYPPVEYWADLKFNKQEYENKLINEKIYVDQFDYEIKGIKNYSYGAQKDVSPIPDDLRQKFPGLKERTDCPEKSCLAKEVPVWDLIQHTNDKHKWSREDIASWLETLDINLSMEKDNG